MHFSILIRALKWEKLMGQRNQGIFSIEKTWVNYDINAIKYFNRLTALVLMY